MQASKKKSKKKRREERNKKKQRAKSAAVDQDKWRSSDVCVCAVIYARPQ
jgi:hypothetical protein